VNVSDVVFVISAYGVILGAIAIYAFTLIRRLRRAQQAATELEETPNPAP
jgi:hypothetical protein